MKPENDGKHSRLIKNRVEFRSANKRAKKVVAKAMLCVRDEGYLEFKTLEGEKIYKIAKAWNKATNDLTHIKQMKGKSSEMLTCKSKIKER